MLGEGSCSDQIPNFWDDKLLFISMVPDITFKKISLNKKWFFFLNRPKYLNNKVIFRIFHFSLIAAVQVLHRRHSSVMTLRLFVSKHASPGPLRCGYQWLSGLFTWCVINGINTCSGGLSEKKGTVGNTKAKYIENCIIFAIFSFWGTGNGKVIMT